MNAERGRGECAACRRQNLLSTTVETSVPELPRTSHDYGLYLEKLFIEDGLLALAAQLLAIPPKASVSGTLGNWLRFDKLIGAEPVSGGCQAGFCTTFAHEVQRSCLLTSIPVASEQRPSEVRTSHRDSNAGPAL